MGLFDKLKKAFGFENEEDSKVEEKNSKEFDDQVKSETDADDAENTSETEEKKEDENKEDSKVEEVESEDDSETETITQDDTPDDHEELNDNPQEEQVDSEENEEFNDEDSSVEDVKSDESTGESVEEKTDDSTAQQSENLVSEEDDEWEITTKNDNEESSFTSDDEILEDNSSETEESVESDDNNSNESADTDTEEKEELENHEDSEPETDDESEESENEEQDSDISEQSDSNNESETKRYEHGLKKTRTGFKGRINALLANFRHVDEDFFDDLEEMLIESDVGFEAAMKISDELREEVKFQNARKKEDVSEVIVEKLVDLYEEAGKDEDDKLHFAKEGPTVFLFVGVNGVGKTTTIGKLAHRYKEEGKKVMVAAGDTFRAGAIQQLDEWAKRVGVTIVKKPEKSDPASVVYDAVVKAKKENYDILLVDTAGRLQNKVNLMNELEKIQRIITREIPDAPHEVLLALDATTGQNALSQAKQFKDATNVTGIILTKLDGTARGGIVLAIRNELHIPVKLVGLGEQMDDLRDFNAEDFAYGLFKGLIVPKKD